MASEDLTPRERAMAAFQADLPLRIELEAIERMLAAQDFTPSTTCLDLGFPNPMASLQLRRLGGYWMSTAVDGPRRRAAAAVLGEENVLQIGIDGEFPFEDKQFEVVILARGMLNGDPAHDLRVITECHRVLRTPGYLIVCGDYHRRFSLLGQGGRGGYSEKQMFNLLKLGFDVLGVKTYCRFWVQLVHRCFGSETSSPMAGFCYSIANVLDKLLFLSKGYYIIANGRRKRWRETQLSDMAAHGVSIGEGALLHP